MDRGIVVGGSFVGEKEWVDIQIAERIGEMEKNGLKKILVLQQEGTRLGLDKVIQKALNLIRLCYAPSVITHLLRTVSPSIMKPHARRFDRMVYDALRQILGDKCNHTEINTLRGQFISKAVQLSPKDGGFGLTSAEDLCQYAYVSSFLLIGKAVKDMYGRFMPFINEEAKDYFPELHDLIENRELLKDVPEFKEWKTSDIFDACEIHAQKRIWVKIRPSLLQKVLDASPDLASKARLLSQGGEGGQIMYASPAIYSQSIDDPHALIIFRERAFMDQCGMDPNIQYKCPTHTGQTRPGANIIDSSLEHALTCSRAGRGNLRSMRNSRHFRTALTITQTLKKVAAKGMVGSIITREDAVQESIGWTRRLPVPANPEVHRSDIRIATNGIETHYDLMITAASVFNAKHDGCATNAGTAASWAYQFKEKHYNTHYHVPEKRFYPIAIEFHGRWHPKSRQAIKDFMKTELADGNASDSESLSWNMDSLLKAVAVSLAYERARAILKLQTNLRIYPHSVMRAARLENE